MCIRDSEQVFSYAYKNGVQTVLNPAPANKPTDVLLEHTSWFIPNEVEFEEIYGEVFNEDNLLLFANDLKTNVVVTLGEKGCAYIKNNSVKILDTDSVKAIDTTGAGDAFVGAFSFALASKLDIEECLKLALQKATDSVTKKGTQSSYKD